MSIISIILLILQYGPAIFSLVAEIIKLIKNLRDKKEQAVFTSELADAVRHFKANADARRLEKLRDKLRTRCFGDRCE
jgi:hypothetical protein